MLKPTTERDLIVEGTILAALVAAIVIGGVLVAGAALVIIGELIWRSINK